MSEQDVDGERGMRALPSVDDVLRSDPGRDLTDRFPRWAVADAVRAEIAERRAQMRSTPDATFKADAPLPRESLERRAATLVRPSLRRALNATGVVLHTNLGRAPLAERALERVRAIGGGYCTLEYDPNERARGSRHDHVAALLARLTGAEAAAVVNNNAAAVLLALVGAAGREVVISRGELVEIGGGFRIPDVMRSAGVRLREVGTTNKTHARDYAEAIGPETGLLLKVHRSNFAMLGFCADVAIADLVRLGHERGVPVMFDLGSGSLADLAHLGLGDEPTVRQAVAAGADLVTFSGDKLLGGPQAGLIVGRAQAVMAACAHPLMRALRPDKLTLAALEATLEIHRDGTAFADIPVLRMLAATNETLATRKDRLVAALTSLTPQLEVTARRSRSAVGGGALPLAELATWTVELCHPDVPTETFADRLAAGSPALVGRIARNAVILDVRTLDDDEIAEAASAVAAAVAQTRGGS